MFSRALQSEIARYYTLGEAISRGSYGCVFRAQTRDEGLPVAIKVFVDGGALFANSLNELRLLFRLRHPHVVRILDFFYVHSSYALVFEYVNGGDLRQALEASVSPLGERAALLIAAQLASGLAYVHAQQIIHCDLKPENILVQRQGDSVVYKMADFNISRSQLARTASGAAGAQNQGSPLYMAPEQFYTQCDHRADLYALGIILFEMLAGVTPFEGDALALMQAHLNAPVPWARCPATPATRELLAGLLAKDPNERFADAASVLAALEPLLQRSADENSLLAGESDTTFYLSYLAPELRQALLAVQTGLPESVLRDLQARNYLRLTHTSNQSPKSSSASEAAPRG